MKPEIKTQTQTQIKYVCRKVKVRIIAKDRESLEAAISALREVFDVVHVSKTYPCRKQRGYRVYVAAFLR